MLLLASCAKNNFPTKNFYETDLKELSGTYRNTDGQILKMFELYKPWESQYIDIVDLEFQKTLLLYPTLTINITREKPSKRNRRKRKTMYTYNSKMDLTYSVLWWI